MIICIFQALPKLESILYKFGEALAPLLDQVPPDANKIFSKGMAGKLQQIPTLSPIAKAGMYNYEHIMDQLHI